MDYDFLSAWLALENILKQLKAFECFEKPFSVPGHIQSYFFCTLSCRCGGDKTPVLLKERKFMDTSCGAHLIFFPVFKAIKKCVLK